MNVCARPPRPRAVWLRVVAVALVTWAGIGLDSVPRAQAQTLWFGATANLPTARGFQTDLDFPELFTNPAAWSRALSRIQVFKFARGYVDRAPDAELRQTFSFLRAHNVAIAGVFGMVYAQGCGSHVEGMAHAPRAVTHDARRFLELGADVRYIVADEPLTFGHYFTRRDACQYSIEQTAQSYADNIRQAKSVFPNAEVVDTEATTELNSPAELSRWFDLLHQMLGPDAPQALHLDIQWDRDDWQSKVGWIIDTARAHGVGYGIIYHGTAQDRSDQAWISAVKSHIVDFTRVVHQPPRDVTIQSWNEFPSHVLPETDPTSLTSVVNWYCEHTAAVQGCK
jgi:hypothetical protein